MMTKLLIETDIEVARRLVVAALTQRYGYDSMNSQYADFMLEGRYDDGADVQSVLAGIRYGRVMADEVV